MRVLLSLLETGPTPEEQSLDHWRASSGRTRREKRRQSPSPSTYPCPLRIPQNASCLSKPYGPASEARRRSGERSGRFVRRFGSSFCGQSFISDLERRRRGQGKEKRTSCSTALVGPSLATFPQQRHRFVLEPPGPTLPHRSRRLASHVDERRRGWVPDRRR